MEINSILALKVQYSQYRSKHGTKAATWMLDCKVLGAAQVWIKQWNKDPAKMIEMIKGMESPLSIISEAYHILLNRKAIEPMPEGTDLDELTEELFGYTDDLKLYNKQRKMIYLFSQLPVKINLERM